MRNSITVEDVYIVRENRDRVNDFIASRTRNAFLPAWALLVATLVVLALDYLWMGAPAFNGMAFDVNSYLDGSWRIINGQVPHKDFFVDFGDLIFYVGWIGMKLGHFGIGAITLGNIFVLVPLGVAAMLVLQRRTSAFYATAYSLSLVLLAVTPRPLGVPYYNIAYAMVYNRYGEVFLALLAAILFLPPDPSKKKSWGDWVEIAFAGFCLQMLVFCKLNYLTMGFGFFALACILRRFSLQQALVFVLSTAGFFALMLVITRIPFTTMVHDYQITAGAQGGQENAGHRISQLINRGVENFFLFPLMLLIPWEISRRLEPGQKAWPHFLVIVAIFGGALLILASNTQPAEMPLLALGALYGAEIIRRQSVQGNDDGFIVTVRNLGAALLFLFFLMPTFGTDLHSMLAINRYRAAKLWVTTDTLQATRLSDFRRTVSVDTDLVMMRHGMDLMDEGLQLMQRHPESQSSFTVFLQDDPYHVALKLPPPEGGVEGWTTDGITKRAHPDFKRLLGNANYILAAPIGHTTIDDIKAVYGPEWAALNLQVVEQTPDFTLFKVPQSSASNP